MRLRDLEVRYLVINRSCAELIGASLFGYDSPKGFLAAVAGINDLYAEVTDRETMAREVRDHAVVNGFELRMRRQDPIPPARFAALIGTCAICYESVAANNNPLLANESQNVG